MTDYEQAYRDLRAGVEALADRMLCPWDRGTVEHLLASSAPATASEDATECIHSDICDSTGAGRCEKCGRATGVTSSDGDRGLSEEEREDLCICPPKGHVPGNHVDYCHNHLYDIELLIIARTAQPDGFERVEWGVRHPQGIKECRSEKEAREAVAEFRRRPGRANWHQSTVVRRRVGPWEVVGDE